ncbi:EscU/YscU/HrcU family type III secretion system export apparatus switch protein [Leptospira santarosai]|uniref:EscU/YscU/HrcU family type III secretion system export apparatus switch protein n=1 Tax=Leptospira santarosai TaxID=28183 RepID=UPI000248BF2A|nr:EscU/YscU/HrcU family type III secretion system export apparatus switch protein [Leptospira santarosai]EMM78852.1 FlhB/HrpN/YscU/SpaS domain protein [Leptospira santarosai str. 2000030832]MDI7186696.1 EscU/YscU/HrcU family type III secretion system export apparatus switch protein [Leptospira santarosai]MDI7190660.1 EscU/YscU/HrcU family type III secretion system export apparatus switch protein [Leptospira santarosai]MDI7200373.1 EscU/YscU/HrcU family type III secretion system export apparatu
MIGIALKFIPKKDNAPIIVASASGLLGDVIRKIADKNSVPIVENPVLAESLSELPVGSEIPESLYRAVGAIFSMILELDSNNSGKKGMLR